MDFDYINSLIGTPFVDNGRTEEGADCYGIVLLVSKNVFGHDLPDWTTDHTARDVVRRIAEALGGVVQDGQARRVTEPQDGDVAVVVRKHRPYHMGIVVASGVLHTSREHGAIFEPIGRFIHNQGEAEFYRWQP